jgi:hypothetical protein
MSVKAAMRKALASGWITLRAPFPNTFPPLMRLSGHSPSQEAKCASVFHRLMSQPTSLMIFCAVITSTPSRSVKSTPVMRCSSLVRSKIGALRLDLVDRFLAFRLAGEGSPAPFGF